MKFRTEINTRPSALQLEPFRPLIMTGSCFAENIAARFRSCCWRADRSLGTLYNPASIAASLRLAALTDQDEALRQFRATLFPCGNGWLSWLFDSSLCRPSAEAMCDRFVEIRNSMSDLLTRAQALFITFGTAWCYSLKENTPGLPDGIVANCHKQHPDMFAYHRLTVDEITETFTRLITDMRAISPGLPVVLTVSPIRYVKDTLPGSSRSKAILLLAAERLSTELPDTYYFPAYELMIDDLRDYRYYADDLVHPGNQGIEYIWEHFQAAFMDKGTTEALHEGEKLYKRLHHRTLIPAMCEANAETEKLCRMRAAFMERYPDAVIDA